MTNNYDVQKGCSQDKLVSEVAKDTFVQLNETEVEREEPKLPSNPSSDNSHEDDIFSVSPKELGRRGEDAAVFYLKQRGFTILDRNWTCFAGEVDIVALDDDCLCFIEVKTRRSIKKGLPEEAVTAKKRAKYEKIAAYYLRDHDFPSIRVRFDIMAILVIEQSRALLRFHRNAFSSPKGVV